MAYSYLKTVFPDFKASNVHNERLYTDVVIKETSVSGFEPQDTPQLFQLPGARPATANKTQEQKLKKSVPQPLPQPHTEMSFEKFENQDIQKEIDKQNGKCDNPTCQEYISHVLSCPQCRKQLEQQLGIHKKGPFDGLISQDTLDLIMYILFGILLIMMLDKLKK
jgi:hypothetical protein